MSETIDYEAFRAEANQQQKREHETAATAWLKAPGSAPKLNAAPLTVTDVYDLIAADLRDPEPIISPLIFEADLMMLYGWRGVGKTWFSLGLAYAIASGGKFLTWTSKRPRRVLVLDGEMRAARLKKRLSLIIAGAGAEAQPGMLRLVTRDMCADSVEWPDLGRPEGREALGALIETEKPEVIVIDNLSAWIRSGKGENDEESWRDAASFLLAQRAKGRAVVLIHHAGKGGQQRGTSRREDVLDTVICLKKPDDYDASDGMRCEFVFEKARNLDGAEVDTLAVDFSTKGGKAVFTAVSIKSDVITQIHTLVAAGASRGEIQKETNLSRFQLLRLQERAQQQGRPFGLPDSRSKKSNVVPFKGKPDDEYF
jgi:KaiC/GvpD/RAD55 family RecA-like ATPase